MTLAEIVDAYIRDHRKHLRRLLRFFEIQRNVGDAIRSAAASERRHQHQWRVPRAALAEAERRLQLVSNHVAQAQDFAELHGLIEREIGDIPRIGCLAVYDIALRIGAFLGIAPALVYLHRGTREGARALGFRGKTVHPDELPVEFRDLTAAEIEDCLCIYKRELRDRVSGT
jgi:hypothetical protein